MTSSGVGEAACRPALSVRDDDRPATVTSLAPHTMCRQASNNPHTTRTQLAFNQKQFPVVTVRHLQLQLAK